MNQPELGRRISERRNQIGITQKELSESCNVDIRTVQRIESGEVVPRHSTLKLISHFLEYDFQQHTGTDDLQNNVSKDFLLVSFIAGILNVINWLFFVSIIPVKVSGVDIHLFFAMIHLITTVFFYAGFFVLGRRYKNLVIQISSVVIAVIVSIMVFSDILAIATHFSFIVYVIKLLGVILGINGMVFGIGLIFVKNRFPVLYKMGGILQILINPFFIIPLATFNRIGIYLAVPSLIVFVLILFVEFQSSDQKIHVSTLTA